MLGPCLEHHTWGLLRGQGHFCPRRPVTVVSPSRRFDSAFQVPGQHLVKCSPDGRVVGTPGQAGHGGGFRVEAARAVWATRMWGPLSRWTVDLGMCFVLTLQKAGCVGPAARSRYRVHHTTQDEKRWSKGSVCRRACVCVRKRVCARVHAHICAWRGKEERATRWVIRPRLDGRPACRRQHSTRCNARGTHTPTHAGKCQCALIGHRTC